MLFIAFISGFLVSLTGSLPLGSLNLTALHITASESLRNAIRLAAGIVCIEIVYLGITFSAIDRILDNQAIFRILQWGTVVLLFILAAGSFAAASAKQGPKSARLLPAGVSRVWLGAGMSAVNLLQFPFWAGWIVYLLTQHYLERGMITGLFFIAGAGGGTCTALAIFIFAGKQFSGFLQQHPKAVHIISGITFAVITIYQAVCIFH